MRKFQLLLSIAFLFTAFNLFAETPKEGAAAIKKLFESKNFETLVKERYTELFKAKSDDEVQKLIDMISKRFGNEKNLKMILSIYDEVLKVEPVVEDDPSPLESENGKMATFLIKFHGKEIPFKLYQMKNEKWGFHL